MVPRGDGDMLGPPTPASVAVVHFAVARTDDSSSIRLNSVTMLTAGLPI